MRDEFFIPVGNSGGVTLLESDASRFAKCGRNDWQERADVEWEARRENFARDYRARLIAACKAKSTDLSRQIFAESKAGAKQKAIADAHGVSLWRVRQMIGREKVLEGAQ